ncbi:hypothetical protein TRIUR3_20617 [Triticum urartu]|uniref:Uncharacterized protein n=1 Tax=Triticum urartu TaxID=4572 RepID=M7ZEZ6_TRIUA|nr:hypothetical protein TRIUR3_20617 [Triticum urartu]
MLDEDLESKDVKTSMMQWINIFGKGSWIEKMRISRRRFGRRRTKFKALRRIWPRRRQNAGEFWMGDHVVVNVDGLANTKDDGFAEKLSEAVSVVVVDMAEDGGEDEPLIQAAECRICQEEDSIKNLEKPCTCNGSLKVWVLSNLILKYRI